jgi:hypothetical protein
VSGTASALELSWTAIAVGGFLFSVWLVGGGWLDLQAVQAAIDAHPPRARRWGPRWWVAMSAVVANVALCLVWIGFVLIGAIAMRYPPPPPTAQQTVSTQWVGWVLIAMEALLAAVQAWHLFVRGRVEQADRMAIRP